MRRRWTARAALNRAHEVLRAEGVRSLAFRVAGELVYRRMLLVERPYALLAPNLEPNVEVEFRPAGPEDAEAISALLSQADADEVRDRFGRGQVCWVGELDGRIVHCCWAATGRARVDYLDAEILLPPGVVYLYDLYTEPGLRGRGVHAAMYLRMFSSLGALEPVHLCATFHPENRWFRVFERMGAYQIATIGYVGIPGWRKLFYRPVSDGGATRGGRRSRSGRGARPSFPGASTRRSRARAS